MRFSSTPFLPDLHVSIFWIPLAAPHYVFMFLFLLQLFLPIVPLCTYQIRFFPVFFIFPRFVWILRLLFSLVPHLLLASCIFLCCEVSRFPSWQVIAIYQVMCLVIPPFSPNSKFGSPRCSLVFSFPSSNIRLLIPFPLLTCWNPFWFVSMAFLLSCCGIWSVRNGLALHFIDYF